MALLAHRRKAVGGGISPGPPFAQRLSAASRSEWLWGLILFLAVFLAYAPVWRAGYVWDDGSVVTANPCVVEPDGLKEIWTTRAADICPLTLTTFWFEHALWGLAPLPYHLVNVLLHDVTVIVLWRVLRQLQIPGAWLGAALWGLHPVQVESVAWITETKNTQSGLFFLLSVLCFVKSLKAGTPDVRRGWNANQGLTFLFAALAMASKSSTVVLPLVLCSCAWWVEGRWHWRNLTKVAPIFLLSLAAGILSIWTQGSNIANDPRLVQSWPQRLLTAGDAVWFYLGKLIWPHPLIAIYPRWQIDAGQALSYLPTLGVALILILLWFKRNSWARPYFFAVSNFLLALLPVLGLVDMTFSRYSLVADHFQYLAGMAPLALAGAGLVRSADFLAPGRPLAYSALAAGALLVLGFWTWQRARVFKNDEMLWTDTLAKNRSCWAAYGNLGVVFLQQGKPDQAIDQDQKALQINPNFAEASCNWGVALAQEGKVDEAIAQYRATLRIAPEYANAHNDLGRALAEKGEADQAMVQYRAALKTNPADAETYSNIGIVYYEKGDVDQAITQFQTSLQLNPNYAEAHNNLGNALLQKGQADDAMDQFKQALEINPRYVEAHDNLGSALFSAGAIDEAAAQYEKALQINPRFAPAHFNLGLAFFRQGQTGAAIAQFQEALKIDPRPVAVHNNLALAYYKNGQLADAAGQYEKILEINSNDAVAHNNLGFILAQQGRSEAAIAQFQEALRLKPDYADAQANLAKAQLPAHRAPASK
jgi:tetratricopeptide (TPR) repeat protein